MSEITFRHLSRCLDGGVCVLTLTKPEISEETLSDAVRQELGAAVADLQDPKVVIDFQKVKYLATPCLRALLTFRRFIREKNGQLLLCGMSDEVADIFFTTNLATTTTSAIIPFALAPDVATAVAHLRKSSK